MPRLTPLFSTLPELSHPPLSPHCMKGYALYIRFHEIQNSLNLFVRVGLPTLPLWLLPPPTPSPPWPPLLSSLASPPSPSSLSPPAMSWVLVATLL